MIGASSTAVVVARALLLLNPAQIFRCERLSRNLPALLAGRAHRGGIRRLI
jgi:hypothetical protein